MVERYIYNKILVINKNKMKMNNNNDNNNNDDDDNNINNNNNLANFVRTVIQKNKTLRNGRYYMTELSTWHILES